MDKFPKRKQNRLKEYDYSTPGYYFVTICANDKIEQFGLITENKMTLNTLGVIVKNTWLEIPAHFNNIVLGQYIIMPNHIHGIIIINNPVGNGHARSVNNHTKNNNLSVIVGSFKSAVTKRINQLNNTTPFKWQKSFHDHIIRIDQSLNKIQEYIIYNPVNWDMDEHNIKNYKVTVQACLNPTG
ncbi:MAG: transposase [bacterium]